jgi:hypothetical protein
MRKSSNITSKPASEAVVAAKFHNPFTAKTYCTVPITKLTKHSKGKVCLKPFHPLPSTATIIPEGKIAKPNKIAALGAKTDPESPVTAISAWKAVAIEPKLTAQACPIAVITTARTGE